MHLAVDTAGIPEFWLTVLLKCDTTGEMVKDKDLEVLNFLSDIKVGTATWHHFLFFRLRMAASKQLHLLASGPSPELSTAIERHHDSFQVHQLASGLAHGRKTGAA